MSKLILTGKEELMLKKILESCLSELRMEIADTDRKEYRDEMKAEEVFLKELIARLEI